MSEPGSVHRQVTEPPSIDVDLREDGLLYMINKVLLHPRGFALGIMVDEDGNDEEGLVLFGNGTEPWTFVHDIEYEVWDAFEGMLSRARVENIDTPSLRDGDTK